MKPACINLYQDPQEKKHTHNINFLHIFATYLLHSDQQMSKSEEYPWKYDNLSNGSSNGSHNLLFEPWTSQHKTRFQ